MQLYKYRFPLSGHIYLLFLCIICQYADDEDDANNTTCWSSLKPVDEMDMDDMEAIFNEYM